VHGRHDQIAPFSVAQEMTPEIPDGRLVSFGGGHLVSLATHTERVAAAVRDFLAEST
jgi:pimeloyl-ACP methyl ester carboxylesterase